MTDAFSRLIAREFGGGVGGRGRRKGPPGRPPFEAHPCMWWTPEVIADHLRACRSGRDEAGAWLPWSDLDRGERWAWFHEFSYAMGVVVGGEPDTVLVP